MRHRLAIIAAATKSRIAASPYKNSARMTGLEPATTGSTVRYSYIYDALESHFDYLESHLNTCIF